MNLHLDLLGSLSDGEAGPVLLALQGIKEEMSARRLRINQHIALYREPENLRHPCAP